MSKLTRVAEALVSLTVAGTGGSDRQIKAEYIRVTEGWRVYLPLVLRNR